jgi:hypothetical protein
MSDLDISDYDKSTWTHAYKLSILTTLDTNLRYFQYKLLHRILTTNHFLKLIGIKGEDYCTFCKIESETLLHLFTDCEYVKPIWTSLHLWLVSCGYLQLKVFDKKDIILGIEGTDIIVNHCILCTY